MSVPQRDATSLLASWWRKNQNIYNSNSNIQCCFNNPVTILHRYVATLPAAQDILREGDDALAAYLDVHPNDWSIMSIRASYLALLRGHNGCPMIPLAAACLSRAIDTYKKSMDVSSSSSVLNDMESCLYRYKRQLDMDARRTLALRTPLPCGMASLTPWTVPRRSNMSFEEFFMEYACKSRPVILTDVAETIIDGPAWTFSSIAAIAGDVVAPVQRLVSNSAEWAHLESAGSCKIREFIDGLPSEDTADTSHDISKHRQRYLFDWSLPLHCPALANQLRIPLYFAQDFLQRTSDGTMYHDSWPSLFIGPSGSRSGLHVDTFGSNFFMALFEGKKKWRFYRREDTHLLYPRYDVSHDATFDVDACLANGNDASCFPALQLAEMSECILNAGEVLFVPAGCPHAVYNMTNTIAISGNYVDLSNIHLAREELRLAGLTDDPAHRLWLAIGGESESAISTGMVRDPDNLSLAAFKSPVLKEEDDWVWTESNLCM